jgi:hypothetical protein
VPDPLIVEAIGLGQQDLRSVGIGQLVVVFHPDVLHMVVRHHGMVATLGEHEKSPRLAAGGHWSKVVAEAQQVDAYLLPTVNYPPRLEKIVSGLLTEINAKDPKIPDGSGRRLRLHLGTKTGVQVAIVS